MDPEIVDQRRAGKTSLLSRKMEERSVLAIMLFACAFLLILAVVAMRQRRTGGPTEASPSAAQTSGD